MSTAIGSISDRLREAREAAGLTQQQVADWLGIRRPGVVEMETGKRAVKSDELAKLASLYGRSLKWLASGELTAQDQIQAALFRTDLTEDPVLHREAGALAKRCHTLTEVEQQLGVKRTKHGLPQYGDESVLESRGHAIDHGRAVAYQERMRLGMGLTAPLRDPWGIVENAGVFVFHMRLGKQTPIDGIFARMNSEHACIGVNADKWLFRQHFTVVHEYGHALLDADLGSEVCATAQAWTRGGVRRDYANRELRANQFAAVFLLPREALMFYLEARGRLHQSRTSGVEAIGLTPVDLVRAQDHFGVSCDMLLWRLQNEDFIDASQRDKLKKQIDAHGVLRIAAALGYNWEERAQPFPRTHEMALRAYEKGLVSFGVLAELFDRDKAEMHDLLREWSISQEFADDDALVGSPD